MYRFLYCCGVRCIEARNLKCTEVHLDEGYVDILQSKAHRDRRLYLSDELIDYLKRYDAAISPCFPDREYFFPGGAGGICSTTALSANLGKGRKSRNVPLLNKTVQHLNEYLKEFHPEINECPLFYRLLDGNPHRLSTDSISLVLKSAADKARGTCESVPERVHCHMIRKTKAMNLYKNGVPLPFIMQLLGHESMSTTSGVYQCRKVNFIFYLLKESVK